MDRNDIKQVLALVRGHGIGEITIGIEGSRVRLTVGDAPPAPASAAPGQGASEAEPPSATLVRAPMVGIFRRTESTPELGETTESGAVVGEIESMGLRNEIVCEVGGTVTEAFVEDGQPVEYGQPIIAVAARQMKEAKL